MYIVNNIFNELHVQGMDILLRVSPDLRQFRLCEQALLLRF